MRYQNQETWGNYTMQKPLNKKRFAWRGMQFIMHMNCFFHNRTKNGTVCFCTTVPFFAPLFRFFHNGTKNGTVCFCTTVPFFELLFRFCITVPFCSVFAKIVSEYDQEIPQSQTADNPMALFRSFAPLFRFLHFCSVFSTTEQKTEQCVFVPLFRFLYYCSVFA